MILVVLKGVAVAVLVGKRLLTLRNYAAPRFSPSARAKPDIVATSHHTLVGELVEKLSNTPLGITP